MNLMMSNKDTINKATGQRLREMRRKRKLSGEQLAMLIDVNPNTLYAYENGEHSVPSDKLMLLALHLRIKVSDLVPYHEVR